MMEYFYLATPYFHQDPFVRERNFLSAIRALIFLTSSQGPVLYSPIVHWHQAALIGALPKDLKFWETQDKTMLWNAKELWILRVAGWKDSQGIKKEQGWAEEWGKPVRYVDDRV